MEAPPDWDLLAVVRSCSSTSTTTTATTSSTTLTDPHPSPPRLPPTQLNITQLQQEPCFSLAPTPPAASTACSSSSVLFGFSSPINSTSFLHNQQELQDICTPMICTTTSTTTTTNMMKTNSCSNSGNSFQSITCSPLPSPVSTSSTILPSVKSFGVSQPQQLRRLIKPSQVVFGASSPTVTGSSTGGTSQSQRTKKRKNLMKKVCHVPAEGLSNDMWAWRKYGQKPIKGSPYPRGYYRCSSSKGCLARKQVERNRSDPKMFIVTYTSEHNHPMPTHRNSLAGSTRQKPLSSTATTPEQPTCSSPSAASLSSLTEKSESKTKCEDMIKDEEDNDMGGLSDLMLNDDFYVGFEQIDGGSGDSDCFSDHFSPPSSEFPWLDYSSSTATAAGGS